MHPYALFASDVLIMWVVVLGSGLLSRLMEVLVVNVEMAGLLEVDSAQGMRMIETALEHLLRLVPPELAMYLVVALVKLSVVSVVDEGVELDRSGAPEEEGVGSDREANKLLRLAVLLVVAPSNQKLLEWEGAEAVEVVRAVEDVPFEVGEEDEEVWEAFPIRVLMI
ncbi:hypothetical protein PHYPSEUDO_014500 [Phytophthora pseudosyringae]|uniref:Uncharacterized protein n=1 Tax=Phytophthora pseudosyringae TaxID=221518 RepID=A0A8T1V4X2_9STRA|nr:hypothetical protein PHYPSEUDO_014500 [Phytophthora pseudosyringae]